MNLGRYEVVRELGKGAMGVVYLAKDPLIGRLVALKTIRIPAADDEEAREYQQRFMREAQAAGILSHPSIVTVHDIGQDDASGTYYIAMEYIEGVNLKETLQQGKEIGYAEMAESMAQVAEALDYAHSKGIVHRDVKPANILFCEGNRVKITDFGIAKIASSVQNLTTTGQFIGTPNYMAPEQVKGTPVDGRSDIFSLGIVLYEWLTRRKPFGGDSLTTISYKIVHEGTTPLRDIDPAIPEAFEPVVARALAKDPGGRFQRGRDMAAALRAVARAVSQQGRIDPMQLEQTIAAPEAHLTGEVPFPDAASSIPDSTGPLSPSGGVRITRPTMIARRPSVDLRKLLQKTVPPALFFAVIALVVAALAIASAMIWKRQVDVPPVDVKKERLVAQQRELRLEGTRLLREGNVEGAYGKFHQLLQIAPRSPAIRTIIAKLEQIRTQQQVSAQRKTESATRLEDGKRLYAEKKFEQAISVFEEAFYLNPNSTEAVNYLRMSREQLSLAAVRTQAKATPPRDAPSTKGGTDRPMVATAGPPSKLMMTVDSQLSDGYVIVKVGDETLLHENIWYEPKKGMFRRRAPRRIDAERQVAAGTHNVEAWLIVPSMRISDRRMYQFTLRPGATHRMVMTVTNASKKLQVNFQ